MLLGTWDRDEGVDLRKRMLLTISCSLRGDKKTGFSEICQDFSTNALGIERLLSHLHLAMSAWDQPLDTEGLHEVEDPTGVLDIH